MPRRFSALTFAAVLGLAAHARGIDGVWMVTGGPGAKGDCMSEFALQWDPRWDPAVPAYACKTPVFGTSGNLGRVSPGQACQDGDGCDHDVDVYGVDVPGQCTFKVGVCFCVDDPATDNCTEMHETRGQWCMAPRVGAGSSLQPFAYQIISPSRLAKTSQERKARCKLEQAMRGCVIELAGRVPNQKRKAEAVLSENNRCCGPSGESECPVCPDSQASPMMPFHAGYTSQDTLRTLYPDEPLDATTSTNGLVTKTILRLAPSLDSQHAFRSPLHVGANMTRFRDVPGVKDPFEQFVRLSDYNPAQHTCSSLVPIQVVAGSKRQSTLIIRGTWWSGANALGPVDRGGGDELRLTCLRRAPDGPTSCGGS